MAIYWVEKPNREEIDAVIVVSEFNNKQVDFDGILDQIQVLVARLRQKSNDNIGIDLSGIESLCEFKKPQIRAFSEMLIKSEYQFTTLKTIDKPKRKKEISFYVWGSNFKCEATSKLGESLGQTINTVKEWVNLPANLMTPNDLANQAKLCGLKFGFEVEVIDEAKIKEFGMNAFLSVAKGSEESPRLIVMRYIGNPNEHKKIGFVGKGLTYDSGGLSLKSTSGMIHMKNDMSGGAAVIGAMMAIADNNLKVNVIGVIAACENMISGKSMRPGDVITAMSGRRIFVGNTDAEGRLTLADAVYYTVTVENVDFIVDIATLTTSAIYSLGNVMAPVISNDEDLCNLVLKAGKKGNENLWRLPLTDAYRRQILHHEADYTNTTGNPEVITAGAFIEAFTEGKPWAHIDIEGTAYIEKSDQSINLYRKDDRGATGFGVKTLYYIASKMAR